MPRKPIVVALVLLLPVPAAAQDAVTLRYAPRMDLPVRTLTTTTLQLAIERMAVTMVDSAGVTQTEEGDADDLGAFTMRLIHGVTRQAVGRRGADYVVEARLDSLRTMMREGNAGWEAAPGPAMSRGVARVQVSPRLVVGQVEAVNRDLDPAAERILAALGTDLQFSFPGEPLTPGATWQQTVRFPLPADQGTAAAAGPVGEAADLPDELVSQATFTFDSLRVTDADSLVYLTARGAFDPVDWSGGESELGMMGDLTVDGAFSATLVWSTGWDAVVSGATRAVLDVAVDLQMGELGSIEMAMALDVQTRIAVVP